MSGFQKQYAVLSYTCSLSLGIEVFRVSTHLRPIRDKVWPARAKWRNLGAELLIPSDTLDEIEEDQRNTDEHKLGAVLERWMYTGRATIDQLISALDSVSVLREDLAYELSAQYGIDEVSKDELEGDFYMSVYGHCQQQ